MSLGLSERMLHRRRFEASRFDNSTYDALLEFLGAGIASRDGGTVVQLSSGYGHLSARIARAWNLRVVAIEPDDRVRMEASRRNAFSSVIYMTDAGGSLPIQNHEVGAILCVWGGGRIGDIAFLAGVCSRVLVPDGITCFLESVDELGNCIEPPPTGSVPTPLSSDFLDTTVAVFVRHGFTCTVNKRGSIQMFVDEERSREKIDAWKELGLWTRKDRPFTKSSNGSVIEHVRTVCLQNRAL